MGQLSPLPSLSEPWTPREGEKAEESCVIVRISFHLCLLYLSLGHLEERKQKKVVSLILISFHLCLLYLSLGQREIESRRKLFRLSWSAFTSAFLFEPWTPRGEKAEESCFIIWVSNTIEDEAVAQW